MKIPFHMRLECPNSYAVEEDFILHCRVANTICDGELHDCCLWDKSFSETMSIMGSLLAQEGGQK